MTQDQQPDSQASKPAPKFPKSSRNDARWTFYRKKSLQHSPDPFHHKPMQNPDPHPRKLSFSTPTPSHHHRNPNPNAKRHPKRNEKTAHHAPTPSHPPSQPQRYLRRTGPIENIRPPNWTSIISDGLLGNMELRGSWSYRTKPCVRVVWRRRWKLCGL